MNKTMTLAAVVVGLSLGLSALAGAEGARKEWKENHPRRAQVNNRLNRQNARIRQGVKSGKLTKQQAAQLHSEDRAIRQQERSMAAMNGGHITKQEQKTLNQEENKTSQQIYNEKH